MKLNEIEKAMLEVGKFHIDGWTSDRGRRAAARLFREGYVTSFSGGDSQYTAINYQITDVGREALRF